MNFKPVQIGRPGLNWLIFRFVLLKRERRRENELQGLVRSTGQGAEYVQTHGPQPPHPFCSSSRACQLPRARGLFQINHSETQLYESNESRGFVRAGVSCGRTEQPVWLPAVDSEELPSYRMKE